MVTKGNEMCR